MERLFEKIRENQLVTGLGAGVIILTVLVGYLMLKPEDKAPAFPVVAEVTQHEVEKTEAKSSPALSTKTDKILVDVKGAVVSEGVYELSADDRVRDAIELAGGLSGEADKNSVNLAQKLEDEAVIYVAKVGEEASQVTGQGATVDPQSSDKVDLNKATLADLMTVSGIGEKRAQDIIAYREEHGKFSSLEELTNVSGIGAKTLEKLQMELTLD